MNRKWGPRTSNTLSEVPTACPSRHQLTRPDPVRGLLNHQADQAHHLAEHPAQCASRYPPCSPDSAHQAAIGPRIPPAGHTRRRLVAGCSTGSAEQAAIGLRIPPAPRPGPRPPPTQTEPTQTARASDCRDRFCMHGRWATRPPRRTTRRVESPDSSSRPAQTTRANGIPLRQLTRQRGSA